MFGIIIADFHRTRNGIKMDSKSVIDEFNSIWPTDEYHFKIPIFYIQNTDLSYNLNCFLLLYYITNNYYILNDWQNPFILLFNRIL